MCRAQGRVCKYEGTVELGPNGPRWTGVVRLDPDSLETPLHWKRPRTIFVDSMSDLGHKGLTFHEIARVMAVTWRARHHNYQILTKRIDRLAEFFDQYEEPIGAEPWPWPHVWIGTSVEDQQRADERIPHLLRTKAAIRFLSVEPLLGPVDLSAWLPNAICECGHAELQHYFSTVDAYERTVGCQAGDGSTKNHICGCRKLRGEKTHDLGDPYRNHGLHWVIVGGESGHGARHCDVEWIRSIVKQCKAAGVPVFVKQLGAKPWDSRDPDIPNSPLYLKDRKGGDWNEWQKDLRVREYPRGVAA